MRPITFVGLSADGRAVIVADSAGTQYRLDVDTRLSAALGLPIRPGTASDQGSIRGHGQMEIALHSLSPKDIQARIRAGATVAEVAEQTGAPVERIERFAGPPLADRAYAADQARAAAVRGESGTLDSVIAAQAEARGFTLDSVRWDAWRREDGQWTIIAFLPGAPGVDVVATWVFDPAARQVVADDLSALEHTAVAAQAAASTAAASPSPSAGLRLVVDEPAPAVTELIAPAPTTAEDDDTGAAEPGAEPGAASTSAQRSRPKRRASVPSWDEILFGASTPPANE